MNKYCINYNSIINAAATRHFLPKQFSERDFKQNLNKFYIIFCTMLQIKKYLLKKMLSWNGQMAESKIVNNLVWLLMFDVGGKSDTGVE